MDARGSATRLDARSARIWSKDNSHDKDQGLDEIWDFSRTNTWEVLVPIFWFAFWIFQFSVCFEAVAPSDHAVEIHSGGGHSFTRRLMQRRRLRKSYSTKYHKNQRETMSCRTYICCIYTYTELWSHVVEEFEDPSTYGAMLDAPPFAILRMEDITTVDTLTVSVPANIVYLEKSWLWHFIESRFMIWHLNGNLTGGQGSKDPH